LRLAIIKTVIPSLVDLTLNYRNWPSSPKPIPVIIIRITTEDKNFSSLSLQWGSIKNLNLLAQREKGTVEESRDTIPLPAVT
jgi:hypothetical protein